MSTAPFPFNRHEVTYDADIIRAAIQDGPDAFISELRSDDFFPIGSCAKIIAKNVAGFLDAGTGPVSEVIFGDLTLLTDYSEE